MPNRVGIFQSYSLFSTEYPLSVSPGGSPLASCGYNLVVAVCLFVVAGLHYSSRALSKLLSCWSSFAVCVCLFFLGTNILLTTCSDCVLSVLCVTSPTALNSQNSRGKEKEIRGDSTFFYPFCTYLVSVQCLRKTTVT